MASNLLQLDGVTYRYPDAAWRLQATSLSLHAGEVTAVIGPNGSGKSTLLKLAAGVLSPEQGRVLLEGRDLDAIPRKAVARTLGYLPQQIQYAFDYSVMDVVSMGRFPHLSGLGFLSADDVAVVERSMEQTATAAYRERSLSHLSGGERQRVYLASILAQEPRLLLLDEPTASLDIHHQANFFRRLRRLAGDGLGVGVVTHDLNVASLYCDRLFLMAKGARVCEGDAGEVLRQEALSEVYGESVVVQQDPRTGKPIVLPVAWVEERA